MSILLISSIIAIIGIVLNIYGVQKIREVKALEFLNRSMLIKIFSNMLFLSGWIARVQGYGFLYPLLFMVAGFLILIIALIIFWGVHKEIYIERTELLIIPTGILLLTNEMQFTIPRIRTLMINAFGTGLIFMASSFAIYNCYKLYRKRRGGATLWLMIALYALTILLINTLGLILTFYEVLGILTIWDILSIHLSSLILPDLVAFYSAYYYVKKIRPILIELE